MKAILEYDLPDEEKLHLMAVRSFDLAMALWDVDQYLRKVDRHDTGDDIEKIRDTFYDILTAYDINLNKLIE